VGKSRTFEWEKLLSNVTVVKHSWCSGIFPSLARFFGFSLSSYALVLCKSALGFHKKSKNLGVQSLEKGLFTEWHFNTGLTGTLSTIVVRTTNANT
jgi:hypothetical protein